MALSRAYADFVEDLLSPLGPVQVRAMFGGGGVYLDGVMFGLIADETLYLKADEQTAAEYAAEGMAPFIYDGKSRSVTMPYWQVPNRLLEETDELIAWARRAHRVALKTRKPSGRKGAR